MCKSNIVVILRAYTLMCVLFMQANQFVAAAEAGDSATVRKLLSSATAAEVNFEKVRLTYMYSFL